MLYLYFDMMMEVIVVVRWFVVAIFVVSTFIMEFLFVFFLRCQHTFNLFATWFITK